MNKDSYIIRRGSVFWFQKRLPQSITSTGSPHYRVSLKTSDIREARRRRDIALAKYQQFITSTQGDPEDSYLIQVAKDFRTQILQEGAAGEVDGYNPLIDALSDIVDNYMTKHPATPVSEARAAFSLVDAGQGETLAELVTEYLTEISTELTNQTVDEKRRHLDEYKVFVKYDTPICELLNQDKAYDYLTGYILKLNQSHETRSKKLRNVSGFYEWCMQRGYSRSNPFAGLKVRTVRGRKGKKGGRRAWDDGELEKLLQGLSDEVAGGRTLPARRNAGKLIHMVIIGMYSGLRIDEIASLEAGHVTDEGFDLHEGKTDSAVRLVPIHRDIKPLVEKLVDDSRDGYLIPKLGRGGPDSKRSWHIQKMFGRRKKKLGFGRDLVFHSLRGTFITKLKRAGVPVTLAKEIVGHSLDDLTFGHYAEDMLIRDKQCAVDGVEFEKDLLRFAGMAAGGA